MTEKQFDRDMEIWLSKPENQEKIAEIVIRITARRYAEIIDKL